MIDMKTLFFTLGFAVSAAVTLHADVTGKVSLKGTPPPEKEITPLKADPNCGKLVSGTPKTRHYVVGADAGLANVFVYVKNAPAAAKGKAASAQPFIDQKGCLYEPYVVGAVAGQPVEIRTSDPVLHNVNFQKSIATPANPTFNIAMGPAAKPLTKTFPNPEVFVKLACNVHPWMFGYIGVVDSPFYAITDKDGNFSIPGLPDGKYTLVFKHLKAGDATADVEVKGGNASAALTLEAK